MALSQLLRDLNRNAIPIESRRSYLNDDERGRGAAGSNRANARFRFGFDIGGTFTDFVLIDVDSGAIHTYKTLTTPHEPGAAVLEGWEFLLADLGITGDAVESAVHGTTLITNALIERDGAVTGLVTTSGFRDVLEMRKEMRYDIYDLLITLPEPLVPRPLRLEVGERVNGKRRGSLGRWTAGSLRRSRQIFEEAGVTSSRCVSFTPTRTPVMSGLAGAWFREHMPGVRSVALVRGRAGDSRVRANVDDRVATRTSSLSRRRT